MLSQIWHFVHIKLTFWSWKMLLANFSWIVLSPTIFTVCKYITYKTNQTISLYTDFLPVWSFNRFSATVLPQLTGCNMLHMVTHAQAPLCAFVHCLQQCVRTRELSFHSIGNVVTHWHCGGPCGPVCSSSSRKASVEEEISSSVEPFTVSVWEHFAACELGSTCFSVLLVFINLLVSEYRCVL